MNLIVRARFLALVGVALLVQAAALAQVNSSFGTRNSDFPQLHPCGLIREDPRTIPWMVQDKLALNPPRRLSVSVDLSSQMPPVGNQGTQGSCTAWAIGYYQKTHYEWREYHWDLNQSSHQFSPAFIYNQINGGADSGSGYSDAFSLITDQGCGTMADCPYNQSDYTTWPSESAFSRAIPHRGGTSHWFWMNDTAGINQAKLRLDSGYTTVIGIEVYSNFDNIHNYNYTYCVADTYGGSRGGHAVTIIGYNDTMTTHDGTGAFKMINSWGTSWGQSGYWWMSYTAARNAALSHQTGYYLDDLTGYSPTMIGRVKITHSARDKIGIRLGVGRPSSPNWTKNFRTWRHPRIDRAFPANNMVFDMTEGEPYITNNTTDTVFVRAIDDVSDSKTGTINYFAATHLAWNSTGISSDTPVAIPDYNVGVFARARIVHGVDVGVTQIIAPTGTVDSGTTITPQARVKNYGSSNASFPVTFRIGSFYNNSQNVSGLAPGDSALVSFSSWTALQRGTHATRCTTALTDDQNHANDALSGSVTVRVTDAGVRMLIAPTGTVDSGSVVTPKARVKNFGTSAATFPVTFRIGSNYTNTQTVTNLAAGDSVQVNFANWTALQRGTSVTRCTTALTGDLNHSNDALSGSVTVRVTNVGVTTLVAPADTVDSGATITPQARVKNHGTGTVSFPVYFRIGSTYSNSQNVSNLAAGDSTLVSFSTWAASQRGTFVKRCSTNLTGDQVHANDTLSGTVTVRVTNVGVTAIVAPTGTVDSGTNITPQARVRNYGSGAATFPVVLRIGSSYTNTQTVTNLAAGDSALVSFTNWSASPRGQLATRCSTALASDQNHANDTLSGTVTVRVTNVGVTAIVAPAGAVDSGTVVTPQARVKNYGTGAATFPVIFRIGSSYTNTQTVTGLAAGDSALVSFTNWTASPRGQLVTRCSTALTGDQVHANDTLSGTVTVRVTNVGVTAIVAPTDTVDSGATITPQARVRNFGTDVASFPAFFRIGSAYSNTQNVSNLAAGDSTLVSFSTWTASQRGTFIKRCSTNLTGDQVHANDTLSGTVTVRVSNVGVTAIIAPAGTVDSGTTITPQARVKNHGSGAATFPVTFRIGASYNNTQTVTNLAAGDSVLVSFINWTAAPRGQLATRCSTALASDQNHTNDTLSGTVSVRVTNAGVTAIVAPTGTVDSGAAITPQARVRNFGTEAVSFPVLFRIGSFYTNSQNVTNLAAGDSALVSFTVWNVLQRGTHVTQCSTALAGDQNHANDAVSGTVTVRVLDVGVAAIVAPLDTVDSGATITPQARVRNFGTSAATFPVTFRIGALYTNTQTVTGLAAGDSTLVSFTNWTALQRGTFVKRCSTALASDQVHANDTLSGSVTVRVSNVGVTAIVAPTGTVDSGTNITPQARVRNYGSGAATFPVVLRIGSSYTNTQTVTNLAAGDSTLVSFTNWTAAPRGQLAVRCSTNLNGDQVHSNDTLSSTVTVRVTNVGVTAIIAPTGTIDSGTAVTPQARVKNYGTGAATFPVTFRIGASYTNTQTITGLAAGDSALVSFTNWTASPRGQLVTRCSTALTGDQVHANDTLSGSVFVRVIDVGVTSIVAPPDTVDSGATITPQARVRNHGTGAATFPVTFRIGSGYSNTQTVTSLAAGDSVLVSFTNWTALETGTFAKRCTTALTSDAVPANDFLSGTVFVRAAPVSDVGVTAILAPTGTVDSGAIVTPQARVKNYGTAAATFPVTFRIGAFYSNSQNVANLAAGDSALVSFASWNVQQRGTHVTRCTTALTNDQNHGNDALSGMVTVRVTNVGVTAIVAPAGTVDSGATITPQARVRNYGTAAASFPVTMSIDTGSADAGTIGLFATHLPANLSAGRGRADARTLSMHGAAPRKALSFSPDYNNTQTVTNLAAGDSVLVSFSPWTAGQRGTYVTRCSTALANDQVHANDTLSGSVTVRVTDVGVSAIIAPTDTVDSGATIAPQVRVKNHGTDAATFPVTFRIDTLYDDTRNVSNLAAGDSALVTFASWTAAARGVNATRCSVAVSGDDNPANDTLRGSLTVRVRDVACTELLAPRDTVDSGATATPRAVVRNLGTTNETFAARFAIGLTYADTVSATLAAGATDTIDFADWTALALGTFPTNCATLLAADLNPANDAMQDSVVVVVYTGVTELRVLPRVLALEWPRPDPMRSRAAIRFCVPRPTRASLTIRSATGALVRVLSGPSPFAPGTYSLAWDGRDERGRSVAPGIYFWRLETETATLTRKTVKVN